MTTTSLRGLAHEQLLDHVTDAIRATQADASLYLRNAHVPAARIHGYPKQRKLPEARLAPVTQLSAPADVSYADFLRIGPSATIDLAV
ncbi:hypothetical protein GCM10025867_08900 [Frondihabitans sucicola]|uniref:Uncharacterized protein n=1 Tax=Frondihabitans sucicola TaxID=1268041 RepID=A0ABM8GJT8_9MICO|nr:hypothetical protein [Frondihabitans sucicola]BDZ48649.1 hypothetical protein GCM10025867_08900 [Frondihabitans sucicola]